MRTRIWCEITKTKHDIEYLRVYILFQDKISRVLNVLTLIFSTSGVLGWAVFSSPAFTGVVCAITGALSLIKLISPYFILSEKETKKLDKYYTLLISQFDSIEKYWYDNESGLIPANQLSKGFYTMISSVNEVNDRYSELNILNINKLTEQAKINSDEYFRNNFNH